LRYLSFDRYQPIQENNRSHVALEIIDAASALNDERDSNCDTDVEEEVENVTVNFNSSEEELLSVY